MKFMTAGRFRRDWNLTDRRDPCDNYANQRHVNRVTVLRRYKAGERRLAPEIDAARRGRTRATLVTGMEQDGNLRKKSVLIGSSQRGQTAHETAACLLFQEDEKEMSRRGALRSWSYRARHVRGITCPTLSLKKTKIFTAVGKLIRTLGNIAS